MRKSKNNRKLKLFIFAKLDNYLHIIEVNCMYDKKWIS